VSGEEFFGNTKPSKQFEEKKIDGVIAKLEALGIYLVSPRYGEFYGFV
jgi:hypothetical protein